MSSHPGWDTGPTPGAVAPDAWGAEVALSRVRCVAALLGAAAIAYGPNTIAGVSRTAALLLLAAYAATNLAGFTVYRRRPPYGWRVERLMMASLVVDGLVITGLTAMLAGAPFERAWVIPILLPLLGGLKLGPRGAATGVALMLLAEGIGGFVRGGVHDLRVDIATQFAFSGIGIVGGVLAGWVAWLAARERGRAEVASRHLAALHDVIVSGIGGGEEAASRRMMATIRSQLELDGVGLALVDAAGTLRFTVVDGLDVHEQVAVPMHAGGPAVTLLAGGAAQFLEPARLREVSHRSPDDAIAMVAPVRVQDRGVGLIVLVSRARRYGPDDLRLVDRIADQMGLVLEAARAFDRETDHVERYRELDRMRSHFVALTSHELRTPVTAIVGIAETLLLRDIDDRDRLRQMSTAILRQGRRLVRLVDDLRTVTVLDEGGLSIEPRRCAVTDVLRAPLEAADAHDIQVDGPPGAVLHCDPDRATQILANLLDNAVQHGSAPVRVRWSVAGARVIVDVIDSGDGITLERRELVFERFETTANVLSHQRGTGLGLPIARDLARAMDGDLTLIPSDAGAWFRLELPAAAATDDSHRGALAAEHQPI